MHFGTQYLIARALVCFIVVWPSARNSTCAPVTAAQEESQESLADAASQRPRHQIVAGGVAAGGYAAFPDTCRTKNGDLLCVFYSGYGHVSTPNPQWPSGGRVMAVRSTDAGATWSAPFVVADTAHDDRDPHIAAFADGSLVCNWFVTADPLHPLEGNKPLAVMLARSIDNGGTWSSPTEIKIEARDSFACSAPIRELRDGSWILGLYAENPGENRVFGATIKTDDRGKTWRNLALIGANSGLYLDAETDVLERKDGTLLAALRSSKSDLYFATSSDGGRIWSSPRSSGFKGHCPHFLRHSSGTILLSHRIPATALHWSNDDGNSWSGPFQIDTVGGAYPSCVELPDGTVYCVYYEEGKGSSIRGIRLRMTPTGPIFLN